MLKLTGIGKVYRTTEVETAALTDISFAVARGEFLAIMGPSGCGKSTLLNILGLLDKPASGSYLLHGQEAANLPEAGLTEMRRASIGFIFQNFNLIDDLTIAENLDVALIYRKVSARERSRRIADALERVGMNHRARHFPAQLSGGQQQRVAVARAIISEPGLILADEPTGNLDSANGDAVLDLLVQASRQGTTVIMVTHSRAHAAKASRTLSMLDGRLVSERQIGA
jgi:putative ABC transport system ATP-binding protein